MNRIFSISVALLLVLLIGCSILPNDLRLRKSVSGTATLWDSIDLGYNLHAGLGCGSISVHPCPRYGAGNSCNPFWQRIRLPVRRYGYLRFLSYQHGALEPGTCTHPALHREITADNYHSEYSHENESAKPGYYQVFLERYGINAEMTSTLRCAYYKFTYRRGDEKKILLNLSRTNSRRAGARWTFKKENENTFSGSQSSGEAIYFYATANHNITSVDSISHNRERITIVNLPTKRTA